MRTIGLICDKQSKKLFLLPTAITALTKNGITVNVVSNYGKALNLDDSAYTQAGASIWNNNEEVISRSDIVCKVDPFTEKELKHLSGKLAITMANYLANVDMLYYMLRNNVTGLAWNNLYGQNSYALFPQIEKLKGEFAVKAISEGMAKGLAKPKEKVVYPRPAKLLILNATYASVSAAKYALANGFDVMLLDHDMEYLNTLSIDSEIQTITNKSKTKFSIGPATFENLLEQFPKFNAFINTSISPEERTKVRITKEMANSMPAGSILYDAGSEYGYAFAFVKKFAKAEINYTRFNKVFYVTTADTTDFIAKEFSNIVSKESIPYLMMIAKEGMAQPAISKIVICNKGKVTDLNVKMQLTLY